MFAIKNTPTKIPIASLDATAVLLVKKVESQELASPVTV